MQERPSVGDLETRAILVLLVSLRRNDAVKGKRSPEAEPELKQHILELRRTPKAD